MIDLHTHTVFSDGELIPSELVRRAVVTGYEAIAITDHADYTNFEQLVDVAEKAKYLEDVYDIKILSGVELTHVPPAKIEPLVEKSRKKGADIVVVHGETVTEPVISGTNSTVVELGEVDILSHPGLITQDDVQKAYDNDICLEITSRKGHNITNGHVAKLGLEVGATMVVNTDTHGPDDLITTEMARKIAMGSGLDEKQADEILHNSKQLIT
ncbi:PHP domain protein [Methanohalobium evestigatum Z-7303]|uniref:PHP domain protein n=1 Tax=Methanohalobium evestigatum (strain ATCC BAA-1072 / DSM 3721 / NBRC 107634 / OCM 161 / Z-7303) TaxID=644295 RepID=D7EAY9_METEZ|nr:histidinol phosphate phosphatase domain-containing protein [Methanohalobium evestigatum]ADI74506.1 PHP domain protein [Methanohalobium evestigatum Z-7303]